MLKSGKVCINAGHGPLNSGRYDPGAVGKSGLQEARVTLEIAGLIKENLERSGWNALLVQDGDLADVVKKCNAYGADYFISIHCNGFKDESANGVETYAYKPGGRGQVMAAFIQTQLVNATGLRNRGVKYANFYVLKYTLCPAVLVEISFITNPKEERLLMLPEFKAKAAQAISVGFHKAVNQVIR